MKLNRLLISMIAVAAIVLGCEEEDELGLPSIAVSSSSLSFDQTGGANNAQTLALLCTRDWVASCDADWVYVLPVSGQASTSAIEITIYVDPNEATNRTAKVTFTTSTVSTTISVSQEGPNGATMGAGTVDNPYTVSDALEIINNGEYTSSNVYVKGIISQIDEVDTSYGNATYYISDDGTTSTHLEVYRGYGLGGNRFTSTDAIKIGDEVIVCGQLTMYYSTPEITQGSSIYSLNGSTSGSSGGDTGDLTGSGTASNPYTTSDALAIINAGSYTSSNVYVKGIISQIDEIDTGTYGNATYYISDDGTTSNHLEVYRGYSLGGNKFTSSDEIKVGDEVIVYGQLTMFYSTPEITTGSSIYSLNGVVSDVGGGDEGSGGTEQGTDERYQTNVTWTTVSNASNDEAIIAGETYNLLKLGTSSKLGSATCTVPAGTTVVTFYCIGWNNGGSAPFTITVGDNVFTASATQNSGLKESSPYTITLSDSDYFEVPLDAPLAEPATVTAETTSTSSPRVGIVGFKYVQ